MITGSNYALLTNSTLFFIHSDDLFVLKPIAENRIIFVG